MENNTLISNELELMREQISALKEKLDRQNIINDQHIRKSIKAKISDINKTVTATIFLGIFALVYCTWSFYSQGCSTAFVIFTAATLAICTALTILQRINLGKIDFSKGNIVETALMLSRIRTHYKNWYKTAIPIIIIWVGWLSYEIISILGVDSPMAIGFLTGAAVGCIIGGFAGYRINSKIVRKAGEILEQIEELQRES